MAAQYGIKRMGGATIEAGRTLSPYLAKVETGWSKYVVYILDACNKKYTLHVYPMRYFTF